MRRAVQRLLRSRRPDILGGAGAFSAATGWTLTSSAAIAGGALAFTTGGRASIPVVITPGMYEVTYTVVSRTAGDVSFNFADDDAGTNAPAQVIGPRAPGTHKLYIPAQGANDTFRINGVSSYAGSVRDISVRRWG